MKKNYLIIAVGLIFIVVLLIILFVVKNNKLTNLEKIKIEDTSKDIMMFYEEIDNNEIEGKDGYIAYALEYAYNINNKEELTSREIKEIIEKRFNIELSPEEIKGVGVTPYLLNKNISHYPEEDKYAINKDIITQQDIANIPIIKYEIEKIEKKGKKYYVTFTKYTVNNPYEILNFYNDKNAENDTNNYDTSSIHKYLIREGKITSLKEILTKEVLEDIADDKKSIQITFIIKDDNLVIDETK